MTKKEFECTVAWKRLYEQNDKFYGTIPNNFADGKDYFIPNTPLIEVNKKLK